MLKIAPQQGPQEEFLSSSADIVIYGGSAGSGKSYAILIEPLRHIQNKDFGAVIFRRSMPSITNEGGLLDTSKGMYNSLGAKLVKSPRPMWRFPSGSRITFAHLQSDDTVLDWHGSQVPLIIFDELTEFTKHQFFYMLSRNRSTCGVIPYVRASTNPDADSWVAEFISWWIDQSTGLPIKERSGKIRYMIRLADNIIWGNSRAELIEKYNVDYNDIKTISFIAATIQDNQELLKVNPGYLANLKALPTVERERLLMGNWKIKPNAGMYFKRSQITMIDEIPTDVTEWVSRWDLAATEASESNANPDWTARVLMGKRKNGRFVVVHAMHDRLNAHNVRMLVKNTTTSDKARFGRVKTIIPQDPGQAGKAQFASYVAMLTGFFIVVEHETKAKVTRAEPFAAQWQAGNVDVVVGAWNDAFFTELEAFPEGKFDDQVDAAAGAFNGLSLSTNTKLSNMSSGTSYWTGI